MKDVNLCSKCSKCCQPTGEHIQLTPRDVFAIAYEKQVSTKYVLEQFCEVKLDEDFPKVFLKETAQTCPFLEQNHCSLIRKPDICASFPKGIIIWHGEENTEVKIKCIPRFSEANSEGTYSRLYTDSCSIEEYEKHYQKDPFFQKWIQAKAIDSMLIAGMGKESNRLEAIDFTYRMLFENYDITQNFLQQFDQNALAVIKEIG